ncbi:hypothetical protein [Vibrio mimicus]|uniref:hypothetical protein n=1 Tax=Vibrio mimicus TaxID=674 RepID=UPI00290579E4|nr:hypothetical protein [Vibrio mimicus]
MSTTKTDPPTTIRIETTSTNIIKLPPSTIAIITKAKPPIRPISVAKSTKHSSGYTFEIMKSLPSLSATE